MKQWDGGDRLTRDHDDGRHRVMGNGRFGGQLLIVEPPHDAPLKVSADPLKVDYVPWEPEGIRDGDLRSISELLPRLERALRKS